MYVNVTAQIATPSQAEEKHAADDLVNFRDIFKIDCKIFTAVTVNSDLPIKVQT